MALLCVGDTSGISTHRYRTRAVQLYKYSGAYQATKPGFSFYCIVHAELSLSLSVCPRWYCLEMAEWIEQVFVTVATLDLCTCCNESGYLQK